MGLPLEVTCTTHRGGQLGNPCVRMVKTGNTNPSPKPFAGMNSPADWHADTCTSNSFDTCSLPTLSCMSSGSASDPSLLKEGINEAQSSQSPDCLLQVAQEVTKEMGYTTSKSGLDYPYLSRENLTFPSMHGIMSTLHPDWQSAVSRDEISLHPCPEDRMVQKCTLPKSSSPQMSMEQYYRVKCWVQNGTFGLESLPGHQFGAPLVTGHPEQFMHCLQAEQNTQNASDLVNIGDFLLKQLYK